MYASNNGHVAVVILLLQAGADKNIENKVRRAHDLNLIFTRSILALS
jgi:ankyrin repeat protein